MMADPVFPLADRSATHLANLADVVLELDANGRVVFVSPSVTALGGYATADLAGRSAIELVVPEDRRRVLRHLLRLRHRAASGRSSRLLGLRCRREDGSLLWLEGHPAAVREPESGLFVGWIDVLRDVGERGAREADLLSAKRKAEAEAAAQADFLANMSHEIRTPLSSIIGFLQVLKRNGGLDGTQTRYIDGVEEASRNLLTVVNDVLDLAKIDSGTMRLDERPFHPQDPIGDAVALIRPQAADKHLPIDVEIKPEAAALVIGDPDRLRQILLNLLSNAVKFTVRGAVTLRLDANRKGTMLDLAFSIEDSGMGIAPDQMPKLFRRFTQADGSIARRFGGTGLGLAISKRLIEAMDGSIEVESTLGVGSRFVVRVALPLARSDHQLAIGARRARAAARRLVDPARSETLHHRRLLVADDVSINQKLVGAILAPLGCKIDFAADGIQAFAAVQAHDYALVLMDMQMPGLDGVGAARAIRALGGAYATLPIVALTANVFPEEIERARQAGMNDVVLKPIDSDRLIATVVRWAARSRPAEPKPLPAVAP